MRRGRLGATVTVLLFCLAACSSAASPAAAPAGAGAAAPPAEAAAKPGETVAPASAATPASPLVPARAGLLPSVLSAPIYAGVDLGIYRKNGVDVTDVETFTATTDIMTLLAGGRLDFGQVTMGSATLNAYNRGVDLVITAAGNLATVPLVVRKDLYDNGTLRTVRDLRGRRVALNGKGTSLEYSLAKALEYGGLTPDDVEVPILSWPDQVLGLANGAIDAGLIGEPMASAAVTRGVGVILEDEEMRSHGVPGFAPGLQGGLW